MVKRNSLYTLAVVAGCIGLLGLGAAPGWAGGMGTSNAEFLRIPAGARPSAMGGAFTAVANDVNAGFWNPAGLSYLEGYHLSLMHMMWFDTLNYEYVTYGQSLGQGQGLGAHVIYFWLPDFNSTEDETGTAADSQTGHMRDLATAFSYGCDLGVVPALNGRTRVGASVKFIYRRLMEKTQMGMNVDTGIMVESSSGFVVGMTLLNLGTDMDYDKSPFAVRLGLGYPVLLAAQNHRLQLAFDVNKPVDFENWYAMQWEMAGGIEYQIMQTFALRAGYHKDESLEGFTAGAGLRFEAVQLDYAFAPYDLFGYTHRFSLSIAFPALQAESPAPAAPESQPAGTTLPRLQTF